MAATELESVYFLGVKAMPFYIYPPLHPHSVPPWKIIFLVGSALALLIYGVFLSPGVWGKNLDLTIPVEGTGPVALREGDRKCRIALSFRRKSTRARICRRRPFDRLEIIIGQRSLARMDKHERKNMHVILKLLYKSDPSASACAFTYRNYHLTGFILVDLSGRFYVR